MSGWIKSHSSWMTNANYLSASSHIGWALAIVLAARVIFQTHLAVWMTFAIGMLFAGLKEYVYDANFETPKQSFTDNTIDFITYSIGAVMGLVVSLIF